MPLFTKADSSHAANTTPTEPSAETVETTATPQFPKLPDLPFRRVPDVVSGGGVTAPAVNTTSTSTEVTTVASTITSTEEATNPTVGPEGIEDELGGDNGFERITQIVENVPTAETAGSSVTTPASTVGSGFGAVGSKLQ